MYQALLYLKTNLPVCLFTHSKGIKIGPSCQELKGVWKLTLGLNNPVGQDFFGGHSVNSLTVDGELPLVFRGGAWYLCVLCPTRQRLALVVVRRPELQHGPRQVPVGQNLRSVDGTRLLAECATILAQPIPSECTG